MTFNTLSLLINEAATQHQKLLLVYSFPTLLVGRSGVCINLSADELSSLVTQSTENMDSLLKIEQHVLKEVLKIIVSNSVYPDSCVKSLMTDKAKKSVEVLLGLLK